jgi:hypothetical protein
LTAPRASGATTVIPLIGILALLLGGCATTTPTTNTTGAVEALMRDENYPAVRDSSPAVRAWAKRALHYVNDLSFELNREREK